MKMILTQALCYTFVQALFLFSLCVFILTVSYHIVFIELFLTLIRTGEIFRLMSFLQVSNFPFLMQAPVS